MSKRSDSGEKGPQAANDQQPPLEMMVVDGLPGRARVRMDRIVSIETASSILSIINAGDVADAI